MKKAASVAVALLILVPVGAILPLFGHGADAPDTTLFSRSYANYTLNLGAPNTQTSQGQFKFIIENHRVRFASGLTTLFDRIGLGSFAGDRSLEEEETYVRYPGTDVEFTIHGIPTAAMSFSFETNNSVYFDLASGIDALQRGDGIVFSNGRVTATLVLAGYGALESLTDGVLATVVPGSRLLFRANPSPASYVADSVAFGNVAGEAFATSYGNRILEDNVAFAEVTMGTVLNTNDTYVASVSGELDAGKVFILNVDRSVLPRLDTAKMAVSFDDAGVRASENLLSILGEMGDTPRYFTAADGDWLQVFVYLPALSGEHTITLEPQKGGIGADEVASALAAVVLVCVAAVALYRRD